MSASSRISSLTPSRSPTPEPPVQPDHFYGAEDITLPPSPDSDGKTWLDPDDDPLAHRGIPVFKPTMEEFQDFEGYMNKIECWGSKSGIVKVVPPQEWTDDLSPLKEQLVGVKIKSPIEQHMIGHGGLFRQENVEKRRIMSVREWAELCNKDEFRAPGIKDLGLHSRSQNAPKPAARKTRKKVDRGSADAAEPEVEGDTKVDQEQEQPSKASGAVASPPISNDNPATPQPVAEDDVEGANADSPSAEGEIGGGKKPKAKRVAQSRAAREANLAERTQQDASFLEEFDPEGDWLPPNTVASDYTPEFCQKLERQFWRNCGLGKPAWYGADTLGSLYTDKTTSWNVAHLPSTLSRILPASDKGLPGVNTPYLYFGMWRATFAWHVEDMDLFSINYIHFGAPKFWYAIPQGRAGAMEQTMRGYFPKDTSLCPQFLRHKSFLASPTTLAQSSCRPNILVQQPGEFVITYPRGYHAGFNLGFNCAESVNFALDSWLELGRKAKACECVSDSVRIDVDQLLRDREAEQLGLDKPPYSGTTYGEPTPEENVERPKKKRKPVAHPDGPRTKRPKTSEASTSNIKHTKLTLKLGPRPATPEPFPCCLCVNMSRDALLPLHEPPIGRKDVAVDVQPSSAQGWLAHEDCANVIPETWVDWVDYGDVMHDGTRAKVKMVFGVDGIVKDRWNLKCSACMKSRSKAHGAPVQCTKGKCPKAFHVTCARDGHEQGIVYKFLQEVEKEVLLLSPYTDPSTHASTSQLCPPPSTSSASANAAAMNSMAVDQIDASGKPTDATDQRVLKTIRKAEVQLLCTQHNPDVAAVKRANKQQKIRQDLLALPPMTRIKIRVSAGVFEVSLIRVMEETSSVEVLWDRGIKREFKWGSVVFGSTEGQMVLQKPAESAPDTPGKSCSCHRSN
ncbi:JmjC-domain-containing protein [Athelia psychrophila]|uniref:[histone H3]-trimethyl-L-lysine(9) demethylase n=1 Tax=Athelia psychrophila TaxID=1759441 RepID=A0A166BB13_9AGAM|nr:JmjC-domain-containing protein [Fibularhizoctonia sp. CBS 109695]